MNHNIICDMRLAPQCAILITLVSCYGCGSNARPSQLNSPINQVATTKAWIGHRLPYLDAIRPNASLAKGEWDLVLTDTPTSGSEIIEENTNCKRAIVLVNQQTNTYESNGFWDFVGHLELAGELPKLPVVFHLNDGVVQSSVSGTPFPDYVAAFRQQYLDGVACGPYALISVLEHLNIRLDDAERRALLSIAGDRGTSLLQLKISAGEHGLHTMPVTLTADDLAVIDLPTILHLDGALFVATLGRERGSIRVKYPNSPVRLETVKTLSSRIGPKGNALVCARSAKDIASLPHRASTATLNKDLITPSLSTIHVGCIHAKQWEARLELENTSSTAVTIQSILPSCSCMVATTDVKSLPPAGRAVLLVKGEQRVRGRFAHYIALTCQSDSETRTIKIPVRGSLLPSAICVPPALSLGKVPTGEPTNGYIELEVGTGIDPDSLFVDIPQNLPVEAKITTTSRGHKRLALLWQGDNDQGVKRFELSIGSSTFRDGISTSLPVSVEVVPRLIATPPLLNITDEEIDVGWERRVEVIAHSSRIDVATPPKFSWSHAGCERGTTVQWSRGPSGGTLTIKSAPRMADDSWPTAETVTLVIETQQGSTQIEVLRSNR